MRIIVVQLLDELIILVILIMLSGFFSGVESALISIGRIHVKKLLMQKRRGARTVADLKRDPQKLLVTILVANNLINISAAAIATSLAIKLFGSGGVGIATGVMTFLILVFGEITPKTFCIKYNEQISLLTAKPIQVLSYLLWPVIFILNAITKGMMALIGVSKKRPKMTEEELKTIVQIGEEEGVIEEDERRMMHALFNFGDTRASEVMIPKSD
ncbi:DUF21 domain-containing protein, partial [Candidatus Woesearchaeota archaeon]|nr:DUF21 domain-containing protein [Candidatus Woesearchaeota archaeon]